MRDVRKTILKLVLAWGVVSVSVACALAPAREVPAQTGRVLDKETRQPIKGATVVLRWQGVGTKAFVDTQTICYHVESAVTDAEGHYATPPWKEELRYRDLSMKQVLETVYKPGYRYVRSEKVPYTQYLQQDARSNQERSEYLKSVVVRCGTGMEEKRKLRMLYAELKSEVDTMSISAEQRLISIWLQNHIDEIDMGFEEAERLYLRRLRSLEVDR